MNYFKIFLSVNIPLIAHMARSVSPPPKWVENSSEIDINISVF